MAQSLCTVVLNKSYLVGFIQIHFISAQILKMKLTTPSGPRGLSAVWLVESEHKNVPEPAPIPLLNQAEKTAKN